MESSSLKSRGIVIDARHLTSRIDGLGRYIIELINGISELELPRVVILHTSDFPWGNIKNSKNLLFHKVNIKGGSPLQHLILPFIIWKLKVDTYYYPFIDPPFFSPAKKNIFAVHDLNHYFFSKYAATESKFAILMAKIFINLSAWKYDFVVVFSEFVKRQLNVYVPISKTKTFAIYHGYSAIAGETGHQKIELGNKKIILYVGNNRPHKNLDNLFDAMLPILRKHSNFQFVVAGNQIPRFYSIDKRIAQERIGIAARRIEQPSHQQLSYLYSQAEIVVYPSLSEGFGFPILEAWAHKVPIATSNTTCLPEVAGDAAVFFDPLNKDSITKTVERVIMDETLRRKLVERGTERLKGFEWNESSKAHLKLFSSY